MVKFSRSEKISVGAYRRCAVRAATVWTRRCDKGGIYCAQVCLWYHLDVGDSLNSHKSKPQLLKRKWTEDMTRNVRRGGENFGLRRAPVANLLMIPKA